MINWSGKQNSRTKDAICVNVVSQTALLADLDARMTSGRGFSVATLNLDHVVKLRRDAAFRHAYCQHSHITADGNPIVWLSRLAGRRIGLVTGSDLLMPAVQLAADNGVPVALFGATEDALQAAVNRLKQDIPGLKVAACIAPPMGFDPQSPQADKAIADIAASGAGLCLLALGAPKQEIFAARASQQTDSIGFLSIGAGVDFLAGTQRRAPRIVRALAAEWLWRMLGNPRRLASRYAACFAVLPSEASRAITDRLSNAQEETPNG